MVRTPGLEDSIENELVSFLPILYFSEFRKIIRTPDLGDSIENKLVSFLSILYFSEFQKIMILENFILLYF